MDEVTGDRSCLPTYDRNGLITSSNRKSFVVTRIHGNIFLIFLIFYRKLRYSYKYSTSNAMIFLVSDIFVWIFGYAI